MPDGFLLIDIKELGFEDEEVEAIEIDEDEKDDNFLKLPTGGTAYFQNELMLKEKLAQID